MATQNNPANYTSIADIKQYWLEHIAPNYFDFDNVNNYSTGIFGYINEVMSNTTEDAFNAVNIARREFYPITAKYLSSLYKMATLQSIEIPMTIPAQCKCALIIPRDQIIENSTVNNGIYECTIDSCLKIFADNLQFMLDYPIKIISKKTDGWSHTIHYDINVSNSLSKNNTSRYLSNKVTRENGTDMIIIFIDVIRQLEMTQISQVLIRDSILSTTTMDIDFDGNLANFEVFYKENGNDNEMQLQKVMINGTTPNVPFVFYEIINERKIRLTFKYNSTFVPAYNSEIICRIYTSQGAEGNFSAFDGDLVCSSDSEQYPYNANMTILGKVNGPATGGQDVSSTEALRQTVIRAYSTNSTITTSNDLQIRFNEVSASLPGTNVLFRKKRDDAFVRLFGAYALLRDSSENIIPTNTLNVEFLKSTIVDPSLDKNRIMIKPGTIFKYATESSFSAVIDTNPNGLAKTIMDIAPNTKEFLFTIPFLIGINVNPNIVGYYLNSVNENYAVDYTYVNDNSQMQFICNGYEINRNSILGHNYYKVTIKLIPASDLDPALNVIVPDPQADDYIIRAKYNGRVLSSQYIYDGAMQRGYVQATIEYDVADENEKYQTIQASNTLCLEGTSTPGYKMMYEVGEDFIANDILATKMVTDLGNLRVVGDLDFNLYANDYYLPFVIEEYDATTNGYRCSAYLATEDEIDLNSKITLTHGIFSKTNEENTFVPISMKDLILETNVLFNNDGQNIANKYTEYAGLNNFTLTNTYVNPQDNLVYFIEDLQYIRSVIDYLPGESDENYLITIEEVPMVQATWALEGSRLRHFVSQYKILDELLQGVYYDLENNFSIDTKFYNTYGKARFYTVGNNSASMQPLDNVKLSFRFGISLNTQFTSESFTANFRQYVKEYIENSDSIGSSSQDIFIMNLIADLKTQFGEISYIEYYGFNRYDHMAQKIVGPALSTYVDEYIPEFVNINTAYDASGVAYPDVQVNILT